MVLSAPLELGDKNSEAEHGNRAPLPWTLCRGWWDRGSNRCGGGGGQYKLTRHRLDVTFKH